MLSTEEAYPLDITGFPERGKLLVDIIEAAVKDTQRVIFRALPSTLLMTEAQYNDLTGKPEMMMMGDEGQEFFLYRTKYNIMDVEVVGI